MARGGRSREDGASTRARLLIAAKQSCSVAMDMSPQNPQYPQRDSRKFNVGVLSNSLLSRMTRLAMLNAAYCDNVEINVCQSHSGRIMHKGYIRYPERLEYCRICRVQQPCEAQTRLLPAYSPD